MIRNERSIAIQFAKILTIETLLKPFRLFRVKKNRITLISWMGYHFAGNPRCIAEALRNSKHHYEILFGVKEDVETLKKLNDSNRGSITFMRFGSLKYFFYAMTSRVFITDGGGVSYIPFKKSQFVIDTWHGGGAYKLVSLDALGDTPLIRKYLLHDAKKRNMFVSTCKKASRFYQRVKLLSPEVFFEVGMPRNDIFFRPNQGIISRVSKTIKTEGSRTVLYAPTFRDYSENVYDWGMPDFSFSVESILHALRERFGGEWLFLYRAHPNAAKKPMTEGCIIDVTNYPDMQELLLLADVLITDYSSSIWDYALTKKPGFLFVPDLEEYLQYRGFEIPIEEWMYPVSKTENELIDHIRHFDPDEHKARVENHLVMMGSCEQGNATDRIVKYIEDICYSNE